MNARTTVIEATVEGLNIEEVVHALFHSIMFNRTQGKFVYTEDNNFTISPVDHESTVCDTVDFEYCKLVSPEWMRS